jgi:molecular chaperone DnaK
MAAFGIDFGTTTSGAVQLLAGEPQRYGDDEGSPLPSIVVIDRVTGEAFGGRKAWNERFELEQHGNYYVVPSIKALLSVDRQWPTANRIWTTTDVAAFLFRELNEQVKRSGVTTGITNATIAIPVGMPASSRRTLRKAAAQVGINVDSFISESTAAVFRYFSEYQHLHRVVVFDWGGGTLDVSVLEFRATGVFEVGLGGTLTAGNALDREIALYLHARIMQGRSHRPHFEELDPHDQTQLLFRSEQAKQQLLRTSTTPLSMMRYGGEPVNLTVARDELEPILMPAVNEAISVLEATINRTGLGIDGVDAILLVGGSSQLWLLQQQLSTDPRFMGRYRIANAPEWDVAHGAALLDRNPGAFRLAETLGLRMSDGSSVYLVEPGARPADDWRSLSLVLTEDASEANLVIDRRNVGDSRATTALQFSTPSLGFMEEEIAFRYRLTQDLTFAVAADSTRRPVSAGIVREVENLHFGYELTAVRV